MRVVLIQSWQPGSSKFCCVGANSTETGVLLALLLFSNKIHFRLEREVTRRSIGSFPYSQPRASARAPQLPPLPAFRIPPAECLWGAHPCCASLTPLVFSPPVTRRLQHPIISPTPSIQNTDRGKGKRAPSEPSTRRDAPHRHHRAAPPPPQCHPHPAYALAARRSYSVPPFLLTKPLSMRCCVLFSSTFLGNWVRVVEQSG